MNMSGAKRGHDEGLNGALAAVLREERIKLGLTIEALAERSGIPLVTVQRLLAARRALTMETFDRLCHGLALSPVEAMRRALSQRDAADP